MGLLEDKESTLSIRLIAVDNRLVQLDNDIRLLQTEYSNLIAEKNKLVNNLDLLRDELLLGKGSTNG